MLNSFKGLLPACTKRSVPKGSVVLYQGEVPREALIIKKGLIKAYSITQQGEERVATFHMDGELLPTDWIFNRSVSTMHYYETLVDTELYATTKQQLTDYINYDERVRQELMDYYIGSYTAALMRITALEQTKAADKILHTLYYLARRYGKEVVPGLVVIKMRITHQLIASLVGLTRETTAVELSKLKKKGIVTYKGAKYLVEIDKLSRHLGEENFKDLVL